MSSAGILVDAVSGALFIGLAAYLATRRPLRALQSSFAVYAAGLGLLVLAKNVAHLLVGEGPGRVAADESLLLALVRLTGSAGGLAAALGLASIAWFACAGGRTLRAVGPAAALLVALLAAGLLPQIGGPWVTYPRFTPLGQYAVAAGYDLATPAAAIAAGLALALAATAAAGRDLRETRELSFLSLGVLPFAAFSTGDALAHHLARGNEAALPLVLLSLAGLTAAAAAWARVALTAPRLRRTATASALAAPLLILLAALAYHVDPSGNSGLAGAVRVASVLLLAYGVLRKALRDVQPKLQQALRRGTLTSAFAVAFLLGGTLGERFLAPPYDLLASLASAAALLLALAPLRRAAERVAAVDVDPRTTTDHPQGAAAAAAAPPAPGTALLGRYVVEEKVGEGGEGTTWRCHDRLLGRAVVAKTLPRRAGLQTHLDEARRLALLNHPHVVQVYDVAEEGPYAHVILEHVAGGDLASHLARGPLARRDVERLAQQLLSALAACHRVGIVHRDVKPQNVLLDASGAAKLSDFGIARPAGQSPTARTASGVGTLAYMAPEQVRGEPATSASDVYAAAVVLAEAARGAHPVIRPGMDDFEARHAILHAQPDLSNVPASLVAVLRRALAHDPAQRYPNGEQMLQALRHALTSAGAPGEVAAGAADGAGRDG